MKGDKVRSIPLESIYKLNEVRERIESGDESDLQVINAIQAVDLAGKLIDSIMSGSQVDPAFIKQLQELAYEHGVDIPIKSEKSRVLKKKKFKRDK